MVILLRPDYVVASQQSGRGPGRKGLLDDAVAAYRSAIQFKSDYAEAYYNLGTALTDQGQVDQAVAAFRTAIQLKPDFVAAHGDLLFDLNYHPGYGAAAIAVEVRRWNQRHAEPLKHLIQPHANGRDPDRHLRLGYVSPDFCQHVVGRNMLPLLREHDHQQLEVFCYHSGRQKDELTELLRIFMPTIGATSRPYPTSRRPI